MDKHIDTPFEVLISYEWRETLSYRRHGDDNEYTEYESYSYSILEDGKEIDLKKHFKRVNIQEPFEIVGLDYFLQFIPADINRTASNSGMTQNRPVKEQKKAIFLTQRLNQKYSNENRKFYDDLKLISTNISNLNADTLTSIMTFLEENLYSDTYNNIKLLDNSKAIIYVTHKDEIISFCCVSAQEEKAFSEIVENIGERRHNLPKELIERQLTLCATKEEFQNKGILKASLNLLLKNHFYSKPVWALTNDIRMKSVLRFLGFQEYGKPIKSRRTFNYTFYLLEPGFVDNGTMMYDIF